MITPTLDQIKQLKDLLDYPRAQNRTLYSTEIERFNNILGDPVKVLGPDLNPFEKLGLEIGTLCGEKRESYGNALGSSGDFLAIFWPDGVPAEQLGLVMLYARLFDKLMRIVHDETAFGEDPWKDIAGYAIQQVYNQREGKKLHEEVGRIVEEIHVTLEEQGL